MDLAALLLSLSGILLGGFIRLQTVTNEIALGRRIGLLGVPTLDDITTFLKLGDNSPIKNSPKLVVT